MTERLSKNKVLLGLSGGVDSSACAVMLLEQGFEVIGYCFDVLGKGDEAFDDARALALQIGIELICEDVSDDFNNTVISDFTEQYLSGKTPNPCIICNPAIKFQRLIKAADEIGAYYIATGHYAKVIEKDDHFFIGTAANIAKDQSYMLYRLRESVLRRLILPLGDFSSKDETREKARNSSLKNADKRDSQEICFIDPSEDYASYISKLGFKSKSGFFINKDGKKLCEHKGILNYTVGQRKGLGIALGKPAYVISIDPENGDVLLGDNEDLMKTEVISVDNYFTLGSSFTYEGKEILAKVRYSAKPAACKILSKGNEIICNFTAPVRAPAPGQSIVFYENGLVIGGGFIK